MLNKSDLEAIKSKIDELDSQREFLIKRSRAIVKLSKTVIYAVHRCDMKNAAIAAGQIKKDVADLNKEAKKHPKLFYSGSVKIANQEFVEALCFYEYVKNKKIPSNSELKLDEEHYLLGVIDLTGELVRKAINSVIKDDQKIAFEIKEFVEELYDELMQFDFAGGELRKKFDQVKYDLKRLEDLVLNLKLQGKI